MNEDVTAFHVMNGSVPIGAHDGSWQAEPVAASVLRRRLWRRPLLVLVGTATVAVTIAWLAPDPAAGAAVQRERAGECVTGEQGPQPPAAPMSGMLLVTVK